MQSSGWDVLVEGMVEIGVFFVSFGVFLCFHDTRPICFAMSLALLIVAFWIKEEPDFGVAFGSTPFLNYNCDMYRATC